MSAFDRRRFLRGAGLCLALPHLASHAAASEAERPLRLVYVYVPNGVHMPDWLPDGERAPALRRDPLPESLPATLSQLERHREDLTLITGLCADKARPNGDGPGDHARACAAFLTGAQPYKGNGDRLEVGVSVDQVAAQRIGRSTRFPSLQLASEGGMLAGQCDSGYPCAYSSHLSWSKPYTPLAAETNPAQLFDRLFGGGLAHLDPEARARRVRERQSVLDFVRRDAQRLAQELGTSDRRKLEEYLDGVRDLERRVADALDPTEVALERPTGTPEDYGERTRLLLDLLAYAFATDSTRVATFALGNEGSGQVYRDLGVEGGHHEISHHGDDPERLAGIARINRYHAGLLAELLDRLGELREDGARVLDRTLVVYGSGIADGNTHAHEDLPILLAGGRGVLPRGGWLQAPFETPLANLHAALLRELRVSIPSGRFGDADGVLDLHA